MDSFEFYQMMTSGRLFCYNDPSIAQEQLKRLDLVFAYNQLKPSQQQQKQEMLKAMFAEIGEDCYLETPFYSEWAGKFYAALDCPIIISCWWMMEKSQ